MNSGLGASLDGSAGSASAAFERDIRAHSWCQRSVSESVSDGNASLGRSAGSEVPVSGCFKFQLAAANRNTGTCVWGPRRVWIACQCTNPFVVSAGIDGDAKSSLVGKRECWQPRPW